MYDEYPQCGACDEYGHLITCSQCINEGTCDLAKEIMGDDYCPLESERDEE